MIKLKIIGSQRYMKCRIGDVVCGIEYGIELCVGDEEVCIFCDIPHPVGTAKIMISIRLLPMCGQSIQGRALPIFVLVLPISEPNMTSINMSEAGLEFCFGNSVHFRMKHCNSMKGALTF